MLTFPSHLSGMIDKVLWGTGMDTQGICEGGLADAGNDGEQVLG